MKRGTILFESGMRFRDEDLSEVELISRHAPGQWEVQRYELDFEREEMVEADRPILTEYDLKRMEMIN